MRPAHWGDQDFEVITMARADFHGMPLDEWADYGTTGLEARFDIEASVVPPPIDFPDHAGMSVDEGPGACTHGWCIENGTGECLVRPTQSWTDERVRRAREATEAYYRTEQDDPEHPYRDEIHSGGEG